jgi:Tfp pilus assembly protein PilZ
MGHPMDYLLNSNRNSPRSSPKERRKHPREDCFIEVNYMARDRWYKGSIRNISEGGAYIRTFPSRKFSPGEDIFLIARIRVLREQLRGRIAWMGANGVGVEFQPTECI